MVVLTFGESNEQAVVVEHAGDWSGEAILHWKEAGGYRRSHLPAWVVKSILDTVRSETVLEVTSKLLDSAAVSVTETVQAVDRLSERLSEPPPKGDGSQGPSQRT